MKTGAVIGQPHRRPRAIEFRQVLETSAATEPGPLAVHLIFNHYGTHKPALIRRWLLKRPRVHVHFTPPVPPGSTWWARVRAPQSATIKRCLHRSPRALDTAIRQYLAVTKTTPTPFIWTTTVDEILASVARFRQRNSDAGH